MWIFTEHGYASVVRYDTKHETDKGSEHYKVATENPDHEWLIVRARVKADLEKMEEVAQANFHIVTLPGADYAYRALVTKDRWCGYLTRAAQAIDYDSHFKEVVRDRAPKAEGRYSAMMSTWSVMAKLQDYAPYSTHKRTSSGYSGYSGGYSALSDVSQTTAMYESDELIADYMTVDDLLEEFYLEGTTLSDVSADLIVNLDDDAMDVWLHLVREFGRHTPITVDDVQTVIDMVNN